MECKRPECRKEWEELVPDEEENERGYAQGMYTFMHCQTEGCHNIYPKGKNGSTCECCLLEVCEQCSDNGEWEDDDFYCSKECFDDYHK
jgi:hypothetical protein